MAMIRLHKGGLKRFDVAALGIFSVLLAGCGGGGGSATPPPAGDFTVSTSPASLTLENGQSQAVSVSLAAVNAFTSAVSITVSGLPAGVTAAPATFSLRPGNQQKVTLTAAATVTAGTASVTFQGASGSLSHSAPVSLTLSYVPPDFSISATPASLSVGTGGSQNVTVSVTASNGFSSSVSVSASGLPAGVTATPGTFTIAPGSQQQVVLAAGATANPGPSSITFSGTSGSLVHSSQTPLTVIAAVTGMHAPIRTRALRTNVPELHVSGWQWQTPRFSAYDAAHRQFFVSDPLLNMIDVFSAEQEVETATVSVPGGPWGVDVSPYDGNLYVGTIGGDIYVINSGTLAIAQRYPASTIGPSGFVASEVRALPGGLFALENRLFTLGGPGYSVAVWDPVANTLDTGPPGTGVIDVCYPVNGPFALSGDRTRILVAGNDIRDSGQACSYDPVAKQATIGTIPVFEPTIIPTPDGNRFFAVGTGVVAVFDAKTLQMLGQTVTPVVSAGGERADLISGVISLDGKTLYAQGSGLVVAFDTTTLAQVGWVPSASSSGDLSDVNHSFDVGVIDETGLIAGPAAGGVEFLDAARIQSNQPTNIAPLFPKPEAGPLSGDTLLNDLAIVYDVPDGATFSQVYVGNTPGQPTSFSPSSDQYIRPTATTPPSSLTGAVDTTVMLSDGAVITCAECFSYGPSIIELDSNGASAEGGQTGLIVGYGFGGSLGFAGPTTGVSVTVGGQAAKVVAAQAGTVVEPYPFNTDELIFEIPPGTAGTAADVNVTTPYGSVTAPGAFHYIAPIQNFPLSDTLQQGVYDARRDLYYFVGKAQIQVLSQTLGKWLSPISLPGLVSSTQLTAIAESLDGSKLAVSDHGGQAIYVLNPDNPESVTRFSLLLSASGSYYSQWPDGLAVTNAGMVYFANDPQYFELMKLDTSTGHVTPVGNELGTEVCLWCRAVLSPDGSRIYGIDGGRGAFWVDLSTDQVTYSFSFGGGIGEGPFDLSVSSDGSTVYFDGNLADASMNFESALAYTDWEWFYPAALNVEPVWATTWLPGGKPNRDGSILFMPLNDGIDLFARNTGRLLYRIQTPVTPASVFDPLVAGKGTNVLAIITANGVSIVDMGSLPVAANNRRPFSEFTHTSTATLSINSSVGLAGRAQLRGLAKSRPVTKIKRTLGPGTTGNR